MRITEVVLACTALVSLGAWGLPCEPLSGGGTTTASPIVARVNGRAIHLEDVEASDQVFKMRSDALRTLLMNEMVAKEATAQGLDPDTFYRKKVEEPVHPPSAEEIATEYQKSQDAGRITPDVSYEMFAEKMTRARVRRQVFANRLDLFDELAKKARLSIDQTALGHRPARLQSTGPSLGPADAPIHIVEFADYTSRFSAMGNESLAQILPEFRNRIHIDYRTLVRGTDARPRRSAEAALCAAEQGKFIEYRGLLLEHWDSKTTTGDEYAQYAKSLALDERKFSDCLASRRPSALIAAHLSDYEHNALQGEPAWIINGFPFGGAIPVEDFRRIIKNLLDGTFLP